MKREFAAILLVGGILGIVFLTVFLIIIPSLPQNNTEMRLGDGVFKASVASDEASRRNALENISDIAQSKAVILAYPSDGRWSVDVTNAESAIDIVWLNKSKKVVYIVKSASSESATKVFTPSSSARYVLQLPAGNVDSKSIKSDSTATFEITSDIK